MPKHLHVLEEVPPRPSVLPSAEELFIKLKALSSTAIIAGKAEQMLAMFRTSGDAKGEQEYLGKQKTRDRKVKNRFHVIITHLRYRRLIF